ncbi:MurR/RpiR family transcriptional regulator [Aeribacillus composti]|uniref:MurR/RpiR family transcriptional regulator n=1 Tax=Aeribacillus composti TaxID=1868734 RepID=A0ABY9WAC7_9BACI|nr:MULTISPECIES: MurR/RpiR family transcriptional regulator [Aeribacillus]KZM54046.1 RpiR family transcriptional regulator [Aeribacillus pallidus]MED0652382.1 MurR/RpiR family transcriptional regulator [Aeribacillus composti]MED4488707.1 MurR/RpiR family transcriptional regulator [Aeribacillus pallidus]WNF32663.1 MurR/RpiR family transcriptional regulator [Aeribacillus composti]BBU40859.1 HTH-type transcriptional regulator GlvR [Aeribacillus pallidus]
MRLEELINKHYKKLNETDLHILKYIMNNKNTCYSLGINNLAEKCNVSRSSILRLAQKLEFSGYSEFRVFLKWQGREDPVEEKSGVEILQEDLHETIKYIQTKDFSDVCELIYNANQVFVFGTGTAQLHCALELQRMFLPLQKYLNVIHSQLEFEIIVKNLQKNDVVIIFSLSGDTPTIFPAVQNLVAKGIPFISITNLVNNRLARMTPYNLYARSSNLASHNGTKLKTFAPFFIIGEAIFSHYVDYLKEKKETIERAGKDEDA